MRVFMISILAIALAGCVTARSPDRIIFDRDGAVIIDNNSGHGNGSFCPPGQAKKGNC